MERILDNLKFNFIYKTVSRRLGLKFITCKWELLLESEKPALWLVYLRKIFLPDLRIETGEVRRIKTGESLRFCASSADKMRLMQILDVNA